MAWIKDGEQVKANYLGVPISGLIIESRVKYGGDVQYTVELDEEVQLPWRMGATKVGSHILIVAGDIVAA